MPVNQVSHSAMFSIKLNTKARSDNPDQNFLNLLLVNVKKIKLCFPFLSLATHDCCFQTVLDAQKGFTGGCLPVLLIRILIRFLKNCWDLIYAHRTLNKVNIPFPFKMTIFSSNYLYRTYIPFLEDMSNSSLMHWLFNLLIMNKWVLQYASILALNW